MINILLISLTMSFVGVIGWFFITFSKSFKKLNSLDENMKNKICCAGEQSYMSLARTLTKEELIQLSSLSEEEIQSIGKIHDYHERIKTVRERIKIIK